MDPSQDLMKTLDEDNLKIVLIHDLKERTELHVLILCWNSKLKEK